MNATSQAMLGRVRHSHLGLISTGPATTAAAVNVLVVGGDGAHGANGIHGAYGRFSPLTSHIL